MSVQLWLRPQLAAARRSPARSRRRAALFRHYLSPDGYTARFGPAAGEASKVESWLRAEGFTGVQASRGGIVRVVPDISADSDPFTGFAVGLLIFRNNQHLPSLFQESDIGGTSLSAPTVAGIVTAAQQGQSGPFGFINPAIYQLAGTSAVFRTLPLSSHSPELYRGTACDAATCGAEALTTFADQSPAMAGYTGQVTLGATTT